MPSFLCRDRDKILPSRFLVCFSLPNRFIDEWFCCSSCKQESHCMRMQCFMYVFSGASRFTSPVVAASARADMRRRYNDRAYPRSTGVNSHPRDRPSVFPICLRHEYSSRATGKYSNDPCSRCNLCFRYHPTCLRPRCYNKKIQKNQFFFLL